MELEIFFNLGAILFRVASTKRGIISDMAMSQWRRTFSLLSVHPSDRVAENLLITAKITKIICKHSHFPTNMRDLKRVSINEKSYHPWIRFLNL